jgi:hypothetical protein
MILCPQASMRSLVRGGLGLALLTAAACTGSIDKDETGGPDGERAAGTPGSPGAGVGTGGSPGAPGSTTPGGTTPGGAGSTPVDPNAAGPRPLRRLTRREFNNTVKDLLGGRWRRRTRS